MERSLAKGSIERAARRQDCGKMLRRECVKKPEEEICSARRQQGAERAETRERFELEKVVSWLSGDHRWRTKLHVGSR